MKKNTIQDFNHELFNYLDNATTPFHAISTLRQRFLEHKFQELNELESWKLKQGCRYFVTRENSALIAFTLGKKEDSTAGFRMLASHSDSPALMVKPCGTLTTKPYMQLGVEIYGSPLLNPWFDRDLSLAGRVSCSDNSGNLVDYLIDFKRPLLTIPSLAIHFDREANSSRTIDKQKFLPPLIAQEISKSIPEFRNILEKQLHQEYPGSDIVDVLDFDLFCYDPQPASYLGLNNDFITSGRLDNLLSCHCGMAALINSGNANNSLFLCTNHEENGSTSTTGAKSSFISDIFERLHPEPENRQITLRNSFLLSLDNAHANHPNFTEKSDKYHPIQLNRGPVIKVNANQRYATNSRSSAFYKLLAQEVEVTPQEFVMRNDMPCGSTIGPMTAAKLGVETIDVGAPTLAMHSIREITGQADPYLLYKVASHFLSLKSALRKKR